MPVPALEVSVVEKHHAERRNARGEHEPERSSPKGVEAQRDEGLGSGAQQDRREPEKVGVPERIFHHVVRGLDREERQYPAGGQTRLEPGKLLQPQRKRRDHAQCAEKPGLCEQMQQRIVCVDRHRRIASIEGRPVLQEVPCEFAEPDPEKGAPHEHRPRLLEQIDAALHAALGRIDSLDPALAEGRRRQRTGSGEPWEVDNHHVQGGEENHHAQREDQERLEALAIAEPERPAGRDRYEQHVEPGAARSRKHQAEYERSGQQRRERQIQPAASEEENHRRKRAAQIVGEQVALRDGTVHPVRSVSGIQPDAEPIDLVVQKEAGDRYQESAERDECLQHESDALQAAMLAQIRSEPDEQGRPQQVERTQEAALGVGDGSERNLDQEDNQQAHQSER